MILKKMNENILLILKKILRLMNINQKNSKYIDNFSQILLIINMIDSLTKNFKVII